MSGKAPVREFAAERPRGIRSWPHRLHKVREYFRSNDRDFVDPYTDMVDCPGIQKLLTVPEACRVLRISKWALYRLIHSRQLRSMRIGSRRLIPEQAVNELIEKLSEDQL